MSRFLLARLLEESRRSLAVSERREDQDPAPSIVYPELSPQSLTRPLRKLLERAKQSIDVIDFRSSQAQVSQLWSGESEFSPIDEDRNTPIGINVPVIDPFRAWELLIMP